MSERYDPRIGALAFRVLKLKHAACDAFGRDDLDAFKRSHDAAQGILRDLTPKEQEAIDERMRQMVTQRQLS